MPQKPKDKDTKKDEILEKKSKKTVEKKEPTTSKTKSTTSTKATPQTEKKSKTTTKSQAKKTNTDKKTTKSTSKKSTTSKTTKKNTKTKVEILEYYDLPYRYNQTIVKILAQTPNTLFVYLDISDEDKQNLVNHYGNEFFKQTKPVLIIHNETNNYSFEVDINDFANSWYLHISDSKCIYNIELGRKYINKNNYSVTSSNQDYIYITSSNKLESPNDHILFNSLGDTVYFRNVKTNIVEGKKITSISFMQNIGKIYNIYDIYQKIYPSENLKYFDLNNPSSGNASSFF